MMLWLFWVPLVIWLLARDTGWEETFEQRERRMDGVLPFTSVADPEDEYII